MPKIDTCLDTLNGCEFFSTCDLRWGYWQTEIDERDRDKTAFVTRKGQWRFKVLSFGLANAVLDAQTQNGDEPVGEYSFPGQSCLSSADS